MKKTSFMVRCALHAPAMVLFIVTTGAAQADLPVRDMTRYWSPNVRIAEQTSSYMRIVQDGNSNNNWILNWQNFDISAGSRVEFVQPGANHIALNRIWSGTQSLINGQIDANGRIYLINQNGILFGSTSRINVNSLVASSLALNISDEDFINNNVNLLNVIDNGGAAFINGSGAGVIEIQGPTYDVSGLMIDPGAQIAANTGGNVLIIAPEIINGGNITTRSGQVVLAAAQDSVYLTSSNDPALRGFLIELGGTGGQVENAGSILAERGNITLAGLAINQDGLLQATSSINENGSIRLLARDHATQTGVNDTTDNLLLGIDTAQTDANGISTRRNDYYVATQTGAVNLGGSSQIVITPDNTDTSRVVDDQKINPSRVELTGHTITMHTGAGIMATGGEVLLHANSNPQQTAVNSSGILREDRAADTSLITLEAGSWIDVSGTTGTHVAMERNQLEVQLTGDFLRDAPLQRDGALRNERVNVDIRDGTPLGDISADVAANVKRSISERLSAGGSVELLSQGGVAMQQGSEVNIAGGAVTYDAGYVASNQLVTAQGQVVGIADAAPDLAYTGLVGTLSVKSDRWGSASERRWSLFGGNNAGVARYYDSYTEGQDAGHFSIHAPAIVGMADVTAGAVVTPQLRSATPAEPTDTTPNTGRAWGGTLEIITRGQQIDVVSSAVDPVLEDMDDWLQNSTNSLPDFAFQIDDDVFNSGLGKVLITEDRSSETAAYGGRFDIQSDAQVRMVSSGSLSVDSGAIDVHGRIDVAAGAVKLNSSTLVRVDNAINVSGSWVNDSPELGNDVTVPVDVNAGSITINASHLDLTNNSQLMANGGGWLQANGKLKSGEGGDIKLVADHPTGGMSEFNMQGSMQAFGINNARGGSLSITANRIHIAPETTATETDLLQFTPDFFTQNGFADYTLTANKSDMHVAAGSVITPRAGSLLLNSNAALQQTGNDVRGFSSEVVLPDYLRAPTNLTLVSNQDAVYNDIPAADAALTIDRGAQIITDAGAHVTLSSKSRLLMLGDITAQGGEINLNLAGNSQQSQVSADQAIWVDGKLDVSGVFVAEPVDDTGLRHGRLFDGGQIFMSASDGFIVATADSLMNVSAVTDAVDLPATVVGNTVTGWSRQPVYGDAGGISLTAAEGFVLAGDMQASAGSTTASAGSLSLTLDGGSRKNNTETGSYIASQGARQINLVQSASDVPDLPIAGSSLPISGTGSLIGQGWVAADNILQAGFDSLAVTSQYMSTTAAGNGVINVHDDVVLGLRRSLIINAPVLRGNGMAELDAAYVLLGSPDKSNPLYGDVAATTGSGELNIHATGLLEVAGNFRLQGFNNVALHSDGDLRGRGIDDVSGEYDLRGSLRAGHNLSLQADQVYATTFSEFAFDAGNALDAAGDTLQITGGDGDAPILSAGSVLNFNADVIHQSGVVRAPLGEIHFNANDLAIQAGSITSVSAAGQIIPFGTINGQSDWVYGYDNAALASTTRTHVVTSAPDKRITLDANNINMSEDAVFDISGGGDLYAWEFVPGLGGSVDHLSAENTQGAFAVLPEFSGYAPYDAIWWKQNPVLADSVDITDINMGDQIYLGSSNLLAAGVYTVLPARYALLPGAVLITPTHQQLLPGQTFQQLDGATIVAGRQQVANTGIEDTQWSGYVIESGDVVRSRSEYFEASASQFFRDAAVRNNIALPGLPEDAGALDIIARNNLNLAGNLQGDAASVAYVDEHGNNQVSTGHSSQVNIAGDNLRVVTAYDANGGIQLLDDALNDFGTASLLLGGSRQRTAEGSAINVTANYVSIEHGAELTVPSLILAASDNVTVASGASITSSGDAGKQDEVLIVNGDGALLRASNASQVNIVRNNESASPTHGTLTVASGAQVSAGTSMLLDASFNTLVDGDLLMQGGSLNLGARHISLGAITGNPDGLVLDVADLGRLDVNELILTSRSSVDLYGDLDLSFNNLGIEAAALNGYQLANENVVLHADSFSLGNVGNAGSVATPTGSGHLTVDANAINLDDGAISLRGFNDVQLHASGDISIAGDGALNMASNGTLMLDGRITATQRLADYSISNAGQMTTRQTAITSAARSEVLAASLALNADHIDHRGVIDLASGNVQMHATHGDIVMADASLINVSGIARDFHGDMRYSTGGHVELTADHGSISQSTAAQINVSGGASLGAAGSVKAVAAEGDVNFAGRLLASHDAAVAGGSFIGDANSLNNFSALNTQLNNNGFDAQRQIRLRQGDMELAAAEFIRAHDVLLAADAGSVTINGNINASGDKAGEVILAARDNVTLTAGANIDAGATGDDERGGKVFIETQQGVINLAANADINVSGTGRGGQIHLRAARNATNDGVNIVSAAANMTGYERVDVEGFRVYNPGNVLTGSDFTTPYSQANAFMSHDVLSALGFSVALNDVHLRPGIEFNYTGNLSTSGDLDFLNQRYNNNGHTEAGVLTLRNTGNLTVNGSLSDGILSEPDPLYGINYDVLQSGDSWSYRLVAGADLNAAHVMTTGGNSADMTLAANQKIRTGTGDIAIAVADDLIMNNAASIYSAGENTGRGTIAADAGEFIADFAGLGPLLDLLYLPGIQFPEHGGDVQVVTGGDIQGNAASYLSSDWLQRTFIGNTLTTWGVDFREFNQGIAAFGGGDIRVTAGGNVNKLALYSPVTGRQAGQINAQWDDLNFVMNYLPGTTNEVELLGGGDIALQAAGDITTLFVHADKGVIDVSAGGSIGNAGADSGAYMLLADTQASIAAQGNVYVQGVSNSTLQPLSQTQEMNVSGIGSTLQQNWFWTLTEASSLSISSLGGDVLMRNSLSDTLKGRINSSDDVTSFRVNDYSGSLWLLAMDGDVSITEINLFPSSYGQLSIHALRNINGISVTGSTQINMPGYSANNYAGWHDPVLEKSVFSDWVKNLQINSFDNLLHINDVVPVRIVALEGDISPSTANRPLIFNIPKAVEMYAGRDIVGVNILAQNLHQSDISVIEAGRDFRYIDGSLVAAPPSNQILVAGPGELQLIAGRDIDLGTSEGIRSIGNNNNPALPDEGADVYVMAGALGADYQSFIDTYFTADSGYADDMIAYMNLHGDMNYANDFELALSDFKNLDSAHQRSLVVNSFFSEITLSAQRAAAEQNHLLDSTDTGHFGYSRGLDAIATLFPSTMTQRREAQPGEITNANTIVTGGQAYVLDDLSVVGDISMIASNITATDSNSSLNILAPGGMLNVGLTVKSTKNSGNPNGLLTLGNGDIDIYSMGDIAVNQSRIQALNGGDMNIWSTLGDIDAGRGAKSVLNLPKPRLVIDYRQNRIYQEFPAVPQGSGIRGACFDEGCAPGDIVLAAPGGVIDAGDAGINAAGNLTLATDTVLNAGNIEAGGDSVGFSTDTAAMGLDLGNLASPAGDATTTLSGEDAADAFSNAAVAILQVEVMGLEDEEGNVSESDR